MKQMKKSKQKEQKQKNWNGLKTARDLRVKKNLLANFFFYSKGPIYFEFQVGSELSFKLGLKLASKSDERNGVSPAQNFLKI